MMLTTNIGRFRIISLLEGLTYLTLLFVGAPMKRLMDHHLVNEVVGPIHGGLFLIYVAYAFIVAAQYKWKFSKTTWKVLLASILPFGFIWIERTILKPTQNGSYSEKE